MAKKDKKEKKFEVTKDHLKLLRNMNIEWCGDEFGAPMVDPKRPYGNSDVTGDIAEILGWKPEGNKEDPKGLSEDQEATAAIIHREMEEVFKLMVKTWKPEK